MLGRIIYERMLERGINPIELLRNIDIILPEDIEETDIDHNDRSETILIQNNDRSETILIENNEESPINNEKIILSDGSNTETFYLKNNQIVLKNGIHVGDYYYWIDSDTEIPNNFKNSQNIVLDPDSNSPLYEYNLHKDMNMYHELDTDIVYRRYKYDYWLDKFIKLSAVSF
jgi:hypothetical protein